MGAIREARDATLRDDLVPAAQTMPRCSRSKSASRTRRTDEACGPSKQIAAQVAAQTALEIAAGSYE